MKEKVQFKPGHKKFGGRKKGVKNKNRKSDQWDYFANYCIKGGLVRFKKELDKLKGKQYVDTFLTLLEYHKPKLQRTELIGNDKLKVEVEWIIPNTKQLEGAEETKQLEEPIGDKENKERDEYTPAIIEEESPAHAKPSKESTPANPPEFIVPPRKDDTDNEDDSSPPIALNI